MKFLLLLPLVPLAGLLTSCPEPTPVGPTTEKTTLPWNPPVPGQGGGAIGNLPQQPRR